MTENIILGFKRGRPILLFFFLILFAACSSSDSGSSENNPEPVIVTDPFILNLMTEEESGATQLLQNFRVMSSVFVEKKPDEGTFEPIEPDSATLAIAKTAISAFKKIIGVTLKVIKAKQPDPYLQGIQMLSDQIKSLTDLVENNTNDIMRMMEKYVAEDKVESLKIDANRIIAFNQGYLEVSACPTDPRHDADYCSSESEKLADRILHENTGVRVWLLDINTKIGDGSAFNDITRGTFEAAVRGRTDDPEIMHKAARNAFLNLSSVYFYMAAVQQLGYQLMLEAYNCKQTSDPQCTPQKYAKNIYKQTQNYWTEVERLNVFGFRSGYPAGGTRMDNSVSSTGWTDWVNGRIVNAGTELDPVYEGNHFFLQADLLAAAVNGFLQLAVFRSIWDPEAPQYRDLGNLTDQWEFMKATAPRFTLNGVSSEAQDFDSGQFETSRIDIATDTIGLEPMQLWRYVKKENLSCPDIPVWQQQGVVGESPSLMSVSTAENYAAWAVGKSGTVLYYDGLAWNAQPPLEEEFTSDLHGVSALDETHVWAVGADGVILFYDGEGWQFQESGVTATLYGVTALNETHVWAVGDNSTILFFDGHRWTSQSDWEPQQRFYGISALDETHVWAVGAVGDDSIIFFYDGTEWRKQYNGYGDTPRWLYGVTALDETHVWAVGDYESIYFFDGAEWELQEMGSIGTFFGVSAADKTHVWVVGDEGKVWFFDGLSWKKLNATGANSENLFGVQAFDSQNVWLVGENGVIYYYGPEAICSQTWQISRDTDEDVLRPSELSVKAWGEWTIPQKWQVGGGSIPDLYKGVYSLPYYAYLPGCLLGSPATQAIPIDAVVLFKNVGMNSYLYPSDAYHATTYNITYKDPKGPWNLRLTEKTSVSDIIYAGQPHYLQGARSKNRRFVFDEVPWGKVGIKMLEEAASFAGYAYYTYNATASNISYLLDLNSYPLYRNDELYLFNPGDNDYGVIYSEEGSDVWFYVTLRKVSEEEVQDIENVTGETSKNEAWTNSRWRITRE